MKDSVCLVTGGGNGLGKAVSELFLKKGAKVAICDLDLSNKNEIAYSNSENTLFCSIDVTKESDVKECVKLVESKFGKLNIVVNCAGIFIQGGLFDSQTNLPHNVDSFNKVMNVNSFGTFNVSRLAVDLMRKNVPDEDGGRGVIINTSSILGFEGSVNTIAYSGSKGAVAGMTLPMARDLSPLGIRVVAIAPGFFETNMTAPIPEDRQKALIGGQAFPKRQGKPEEFARLVNSIVKNPMLNGTVIHLDAGLKISFSS